jgi:hypothetical protein
VTDAGPAIEVRPVSVFRNQISMLVPPFIEQHTNQEIIGLANELLRLTREVRVLAGQFYLYKAMTRSPRFVEAFAASSAQDGVNIVVGALMRTMVVSIAAAFDADSRTSNLPKLLKKALKPNAASQFARFHQHYGVAAEGEVSRLRLVSYQRALKNGRVRQAADRLTHVRMTHVAHFDAAPAPKTDSEKAIIRDLDLAVLGLGIVVAEANVFVLGRRIDFPELRKVLHKQADDLCDVMTRGADDIKPASKTPR